MNDLHYLAVAEVIRSVSAVVVIYCESARILHTMLITFTIINK